MPVTLKTIRSRSGEWTERFPDGDSLTVRYSLDKMTPDYQSGVIEKLPKPYTMYQFWAAMLEVVESWDMLGADGQPIPITAEAFEAEQVPLPILQYVHTHTWDDARVDPLRRGTSSVR